MYTTHFGLRHRPFRSTPDSTSYYPATNHEQALARLHHAIQDEEGMILLTGGPGAGKTLLCHCLLERLGEEVSSSFITNSHLNDRTSLLQAILYDFSLPHEGGSEQELRLVLTDYLLKNYSEGRKTLLIVDEAQNLAVDLLEELRLLGNLEGKQAKALQIVFVGQPELLETLRTPALAGLNQRLVTRIHLEPLAANEAADYVIQHLRAAGGSPAKIISEEALEIVVRGSQGIPRLLGQAAQQSLLVAFMAGAGSVDAEVALESLSLLGLYAEAVAAEDREIMPVETGDGESEEELTLDDELEKDAVLALGSDEYSAPRHFGGPHLGGETLVRHQFSPPQRPA